jgi:hypothetical protein
VKSVVSFVVSAFHRRAVFRAVLVAFFTGHLPTLAHAQDDTLIVPGLRVGSVYLGIAEQALYSQLGGPSAVTSSPGSLAYVYPKLGLYIYIDTRTHKVFEVDIAQNVEFHTVEGIKIGSPKLAVHTQLIEAHENWPPLPGGFGRVDYKNGLTLAFTPNATIFKISIWLPGGPHF